MLPASAKYLLVLLGTCVETAVPVVPFEGIVPGLFLPCAIKHGKVRSQVGFPCSELGEQLLMKKCELSL